MKKLLLIIITSAALMSCGRERKSVRLPNGALITVTNTSDINYGVGSRVCTRKTSFSSWEICTDGEMQDTTYIHSYKQDGATKTAIIIHKTGVISGHL